MSSPRFSIVICNHNYGEFVGDAVRSCLAQDYPAAQREIIVVDDGSTDDSRARLAEFAADDAVSVVEQPNAGQASAFAEGVLRARGDLVCLLDSDDWFAPDKLARVDAHVATLGEDPDSLVLFHDYDTFDQRSATVVEPTWLGTRALRVGAGAALARPHEPVYVPIPCGQVYGRALVARVCACLPTADWKQGADATIGFGAFLLARRLHYLPRALATYRLHGRNAMGGVLAGRKIAKRSTFARWPKRVWFLEKLADTLDDGDTARQERLAYVKRFERNVRTTSAARRLPQARVSFVIDGCSGDCVSATLEAVAAQSYGAVETVVVESVTGAHEAHAHGARAAQAAPGACRLERLAVGFAAARGEFITFLEPGDLPDPMFTERHLAALQYDQPTMVSCSDVRMLGPSGAIQHSSPMLASAVWTAPVRRAGPFDTHLAQLLLPPLACAMIRRSAMLELLLARGASAAGRALAERALWLLPRYADALGGRIEILECLLSRPVDDPVRVLQLDRNVVPDAHGRPQARADLSDVALLLLDVYCAGIDRFRAVYDEQWRAQFVAWLASGHVAPTMDRLRAVAREYADEETLDLLDAIEELSARHVAQASPRA